MEIDDATYDIDNVDIEEEMNQHDIEEEEAQMEEEQERKEQEAYDKKCKKNRSILNAQNLKSDLAIKNERDRTVYKWKKKGSKEIYSGYVVYKFDDDAYIFLVETESGKMPRKIRLSEITQ